MKNSLIIILSIAVISAACKKESSGDGTPSVAITTTTTTPTGQGFTDLSKVTATVNGSYSFVSLNNFGVRRLEGKSTGQPKHWYIQAYTDTGSVNINLPKIQFEFHKVHIGGGTFAIDIGTSYNSTSVIASYRIDNIVYKALSGTITITQMDTVADAYGHIDNLKATFNFQTDTNTTTHLPYIITNGIVDIVPL
jgi:hypothetical protein